MVSAARLGACGGIALVVALMACSRSSGPTVTSPAALPSASATEVRVERGGGSGGGGGTAGDAQVEGTFVFTAGGETTSGTYLGFLSSDLPEVVTLGGILLRKSDDAVFTVPVVALDSRLTSDVLTLGVSPNPETRILDFRVRLDQTFTATADSTCPTGVRHTFVLTGQIPQFGRSTLTLTHCEAVF